MTPARPLPWRLAAATGLSCCVIGLIVGIATNDLWLAATPLLLAAAILVIRYFPLRVGVLVLIFVALVVDNPQERPAMALWESGLFPPGVLLYSNLDTVLGIPSLHFSLLDLLLAVLALVTLLRRAFPSRAVEPGATQSARPMALFLLLTFLSVVALEAWGLMRGGDFKSSLWQVRELLWFPVIGLILLSTLRGPKDQATIGLLVIAAAFVKTLEGLYFFAVIAPALHVHPQYVTIHSDTVLFVTALMIAVSYWLAAPGRTSRILLWSTAAATAVGIVINGRRLAYVDVVACLGLIYFLLPKSPIKRTATRMAILAMPLLLIYCVVGWGSSARIFAPVHALSTVASKQDRSSLTRDIENYNLLYTLKQNRLFGSGFGHEYIEISKGDSISQFFSLYRFIGHNSVLWLWMVGGVVGFSAFWMVLVGGIFFAVRAFWLSRRPIDRAAALSAVCCIVAFMLQAYGDMGLQSWTSMWLLAVSLAMSAKLAVAVGAWPVASRQRRPEAVSAASYQFVPRAEPI
jgi:hypothetical protein